MQEKTNQQIQTFYTEEEMAELSARFQELGSQILSAARDEL